MTLLNNCACQHGHLILLTGHERSEEGLDISTSCQNCWKTCCRATQMPLSRPLMPASVVQVCSALTRPTKLFFAVEASPALAAWLTVLRLEKSCCAASLVWADVLTVSAALRNSATHAAL